MSGGGSPDAVAVDFGHDVDERAARDHRDRQPGAVTTHVTHHVTPARAVNTPRGPDVHVVNMTLDSRSTTTSKHARSMRFHGAPVCAP